MTYRMLLLDIDGTLRPYSRPVIPAENVAAVQAVQRSGVRIAIATGRGPAVISRQLMNGLEPDYWLCGVGTYGVDSAGRELFSCRMTCEQVEALTGFCLRHRLPLLFNFSDRSLVYCGLSYFEQRYGGNPNGRRPTFCPDRDYHRQELPFSAYAMIPTKFRSGLADYGLSLQFFFYPGKDTCDITRLGQDKATGLAHLLECIGMAAEECVFMGDSGNDIALLRAAGLSFCMADGSEDAKAAAHRICPAAEDFGVAETCRLLWPEAFAVCPV